MLKDRFKQLKHQTLNI